MFALLLAVSLTAAPAEPSQARVIDAKARRTADVEAMLGAVGLTQPVAEVYLRAFKREKVLELWANQKAGAPLALVKRYPVCAASGVLGPKRKEGDQQVPEGAYELVEFNPESSYHLSMKVNYPNASDLVRSDKQHPGSLIYIHGNCVSIGCIAIEDAPIEEVYLVAQGAKKKPVLVDLLPFALTDEALAAEKESAHLALWQELKPGFDAFEKTKRPARPKVDRKTGAYVYGRPGR